MDHPWYIIVEGAIGVGKTTLARLLSQNLRTGLLLEVFEENPFLAKFYESRARYAFQTQMFFSSAAIGNNSSRSHRCRGRAPSSPTICSPRTGSLPN